MISVQIVHILGGRSFRVHVMVTLNFAGVKDVNSIIKRNLLLLLSVNVVFDLLHSEKRVKLDSVGKNTG